MVGRTIGRYRVLELVGRGGMGEVYLAEDTALGRKAALKFLAEGLRHNPAARCRFVREAKAAAALDHPFICKVYEAGEIDGNPFIAMEYVEGRLLHSSTPKGGMPLGEVLQVATEIAEALEAAHAKGIVHRDLKPTNIFLTAQGHVKVLDFGLARWLPEFQGRPGDGEPDAQTTITADGSTPGTPAYMSPEQLRGQSASRQSDLFAFGIVLYEMLTGVHPFLRGSPMGTADAIFHATEPPLTRYRADVPELLQHTVHKALAKDPGLRYQSAHEVRTDLIRLLQPSPSLATPRPRTARAAGWLRAKGWVAALAALVAALAVWVTLDRRRPESAVPRVTADSVQNSIAVLPFVDMSPERDLEYFCDGIAEQIISALSGIDRLHITARTSAFAFKGRNEDVREIGRKLRVEKLLEGSVRRTADRLRVGAQLVNVSDGFRVWSKTYDRPLADVLEVQEEIARDVARELRFELGAQGRPPASSRPAAAAEAYLLYLKGRYFWNQRTAHALETSIEYFQQALQHDPDFALAYVGIADAYNLLEVYKGIAPAVALARAREAVGRALELDDMLAEAHASQAALLVRESDWEGAEREYRRALKLKSGDAMTRCWYAVLLAGLGRHAEAFEHIRRALELDPLSSYVNMLDGYLLYVARRYDEAARQLTSTLELDPEYHLAHDQLAFVYAQMGMHPQAVAAARRAAALAGDADTSLVLGYACAVAGRRQEALAIQRRLIDHWREGKGSPGRVAILYAGLGDRDRALEWLETARREHDMYIMHLKVEPAYDALRSDPRFRQLLEKVGLDE